MAPGVTFNSSAALVKDKRRAAASKARRAFRGGRRSFVSDMVHVYNQILIVVSLNNRIRLFRFLKTPRQLKSVAQIDQTELYPPCASSLRFSIQTTHMSPSSAAAKKRGAKFGY